MATFGNSVYRYRDESIFNEAYIGKTQTLLDIEAKINELRTKNLKFYSNISQSGLVLAINRLFEKQFGMDTFALQIDSTTTFNAYTMVFARAFDIQNSYDDLSKMVTGTMNEGFRFKEGNPFCIVVNISYGLLASKKFTDAEILAIILHEIGHNFADCLYGRIRIANRDLIKAYEQWLASQAVLMGILSALTLGLCLPFYFKIKQQQKEFTNSDKKIKYTKKHSKLAGLIKGLKGKHKDREAFIGEILARMGGGNGMRNSMRAGGEQAKQRAKNSINRQNEVIADKFAGIYGYGPEIARALTHLSFHETEAAKTMRKLGGGFKKASRDFNDAWRHVTEFDEHPALVQRINEEIKLLEREIAKEDVDSKLKKVMMEQLADLKKILDDISDTSKKLNKDDKAETAYNAYIRDELPDAVEDEIEDEIEEALDKLLEEDKKKHKKSK